MIKISNELKTKLLAVQSSEEAAALVKADGQEISAKETARLWEEIGKYREQDDQLLSLDELEAVSGGADRDWVDDGCAATVEPNSWCSSNDACIWDDVTYDKEPISLCDNCKQSYVYEAYYGANYTYWVCPRCGFEKRRPY